MASPNGARSSHWPGGGLMTFFSVTVTLPRTTELTICAYDEQTARRAATEFVETAFSNALRWWDDNEPILDDEGQPLGTVQIEMPNEGDIELAAGAIEITAREPARH